MHVYLKTDDFLATRSANPLMQVKGDGGYVVAPGSVHQSGVIYEQINPGVKTVLHLAQGTVRYIEEVYRQMSHPLGGIPEDTYRKAPDTLISSFVADEFATEYQSALKRCNRQAMRFTCVRNMSHQESRRIRCRKPGCPVCARKWAHDWLRENEHRWRSWQHPKIFQVRAPEGAAWSGAEALALATHLRKAIRDYSVGEKPNGSDPLGNPPTDFCHGNTFLVPEPGPNDQASYFIMVAGEVTAEMLQACMPKHRGRPRADRSDIPDIVNWPIRDMRDQLFRILWTLYSAVNLWEPGREAQFFNWAQKRLPGKSVVSIELVERTTATGETKMVSIRGGPKPEKADRKCSRCGGFLRAALGNEPIRTFEDLVAEGKWEVYENGFRAVDVVEPPKKETVKTERLL
jgi:hypothetical protein